MGQLRFGQAQFGGYGGDTPTYGPADFGVPFTAGYFPKAAQIVSGANHACVLSDHVLCWGDDQQAPPPPSAGRPWSSRRTEARSLRSRRGATPRAGPPRAASLTAGAQTPPRPQSRPGGPTLPTRR